MDEIEDTKEVSSSTAFKTSVAQEEDTSDVEGQKINSISNDNVAIEDVHDGTTFGLVDEYTHEMQEIQEIQRTFSSVVRDFEGESSTEKILTEYNKMYAALRESHKQQKKYMLECSSLRCDIKNNAEKVNLALHLSQEDKEIINNLSKQVHQAWDEVEVITEKEARARGIIIKLRDEISALTSLVESGSGIQELQNVAHEAVLERKELEQSLLTMREDLEFKDLKILELNDRIQFKDSSFAKEMASMKEKLLGTEKKRDEYKKKMEDMEDHCQLLERVRGNLTTDNANTVAELDSFKAKVLKLEKDEADLKSTLAKVTQHGNEQMELSVEKSKELAKINSDLDAASKRLKYLQSSNEMLKKKVDNTNKYVIVLERNLKKKEGEVESLKRKCRQDAFLLKNLHQELNSEEEERKRDHMEIHNLNTNLGSAQQNILSYLKKVEELKRLSHVENMKFLKLKSEKSEMERDMKLLESQNINANKELNEITMDLLKAIDTVHTLDSDKEQLYGRINKIIEVVTRLATDNENKDAKLLMLLKVNREQETQIHTAQTNLIHMTNQRDNISNEMHLVQLRNDELSLSNLNLGKQSTSLTEELYNKELELERMKSKVVVLKSEIHKLQNEIISWQESDQQRRHKINELEKMIRNMDIILCKKEKQIGKLHLDVDQVVTQRNLLGYQCSKKKELIQFLTEKNKLMQGLFNVGSRAFNHQTSLLQQFQLKSFDMRREKNNLMHKLEKIDDYKEKMGLANQQLVRALAKFRAMQVEHPMNLHRWRHLKAINISQYEMVMKVQYLIQRVIIKTDEVTKLESVLYEKTLLIDELKQVLKRRPGPEIVKKAESERQAKDNLSKKLKTVVAERNMFIAKIDLKTAGHQKMKEKLLDEKKKLVALNKSNIKLRSKLTALPRITPKLNQVC